MDLAGASLQDSSNNQFVFPVGSIIAAQSYLIIRFNPNAPFSPTNTGFGLKANGDRVTFSPRLGEVGPIDQIAFGIQTADYTIGRVPDGADIWTLTIPTFGGPNAVAALGDSFFLTINEWMADPRGCNDCDWFELYNSSSLPLALGDCI